MTRLLFPFFALGIVLLNVSRAFQNRPLQFAPLMRWTPLSSPSNRDQFSTFLWSDPKDNTELSQEDKLSRLGYRSDEVKPKRREEPIKVQVNEVGNVDAATLTAVGFGLIAFNFFVLANLGDGGIAGGVAMVINMLKE